jgi:hypothetical protein
MDVTFVVLKDVAGTGLVATTGRGRPSNEEKKLGKFGLGTKISNIHCCDIDNFCVITNTLWWW